VTLAQYNYPYKTDYIGELPAEPVKVACETIKLADKMINLSSVSFLAGLLNPLLNQFEDTQSELKKLRDVVSIFIGKDKCLDIGNGLTPSVPNGWSYLACTEMVMPLDQRDGVTDMFSPKKWDSDKYTQECKKTWDADVRPYWAYDYFGGRDFINEINNYTNIVFTNGTMDPWNAGCPQKSENPKVVVINADAAHHLDLRLPNEKDPQSIKDMRELVRANIKTWLFE
jgi:dipeptidyl-peptidase-2